MPSITTWTRLEPWTRHTNMSRGLQAQVHDPLWLLARQWQLGEFLAEDAGSPVSARIRGQVTQLDRFFAGPIPSGSVQGQPYNPNIPLEQRVEQEPVIPQASMRERVDASLHFFRLLKANDVDQYRPTYLNQYPLPNDIDYPDRDSDRYLRIVHNRALDSRRLYQDLKESLRSNALPSEPAIAPADQAAVMQAAQAWLTWYDQSYSVLTQTTEAWRPERMEYSFAVGAHQHSAYAAQEYHGGHLDWYHFNQTRTLQIESTPENSEPQSYVKTVIPSPVSFRGMPEGRWWTFEDADVNLGNLDAGKEDLGRMLLLQYALAYSDDWFLMPVELEIGSILEIQSLVITDNFGVRTLIHPFDQVDGEAGAWTMFTYATMEESETIGNSRGNQLFLPPTLSSSLHSQPIEEVHFLRDEMANLAWAVEYKVENARGQAYNRHEANLLEPIEPLTDILPADAELTYHLMNQVPAHWIPLVPINEGNPPVMRLKRGRMINMPLEGPAQTAPKGHILALDQSLTIENEEIERAGVHVTRAYQFTRWLNGQSYLWIARNKRIGRGEGWSGLRFDVVETIPEPVLDTTPVDEDPGDDTPPIDPTPVLPTLTSLTPASALQGETVVLTLTGTHLQDTTFIVFSGNGLKVGPINVVNTEQLTVELAIAESATPSSRTFQVTTSDRTVESQTFNLSFDVLELIQEPVLPTVTRISPTSVRRTETVTFRIDGTELSPVTQVRLVRGGASMRSLRIINPQQLEVRWSISSSAPLGEQQFELVTPDGTVESGAVILTIRSAPSRPPTSPSGTSSNRAIGGNLL